MFATILFSAHILFIFGIFGALFRRDNLVITLVCFEMSLLGIAVIFLVSGIYLDDIVGPLVFFLLLTLAGVESALGLALIIVYYRASTSVTYSKLAAVKG